jgi:hypothetical protein
MKYNNYTKSVFVLDIMYSIRNCSQKHIDNKIWYKTLNNTLIPSELQLKQLSNNIFLTYLDFYDNF